MDSARSIPDSATPRKIHVRYYHDLQTVLYHCSCLAIAVPNIIVQPVLGTIYTTSKAKISEHGGGSDDDRQVACFASSPKPSKKTFPNQVDTSQVAPVILKVLSLDPSKLQGVQIKRTKPLNGF
jgi:hypothetical protein